MIQVAKIIGAGLAITGLIGAVLVIGVVFGAFILGIIAIIGVLVFSFILVLVKIYEILAFICYTNIINEPNTFSSSLRSSFSLMDPFDSKKPRIKGGKGVYQSGPYSYC